MKRKYLMQKILPFDLKLLEITCRSTLKLKSVTNREFSSKQYQYKNNTMHTSGENKEKHQFGDC